MNYRFWVGSYRASKDEPSIHEIILDTSNETLTIAGQYSGVENPSYLAEADSYLYTTSETMEGQAALFKINQNGQLELKSLAQAGELAPCQIYAEGTYAWTANYGGSVTKFKRAGDLLQQVAVCKHEGTTGPHERQDAPHVHSVTPFPGGTYLLVCDHGTDTLVVYDKESMEIVNEVQLPPGSGPRMARFHPDKPVVYVMNELNSSVSVYRIKEKGDMTHLNTLSALPDDYQGRQEGADFQFSPDRRFLYASVRYWDGIAIFQISDDGTLSVPRLLKVDGQTPRSFCILKSEPYAVIGYQDSHELWLYKIEKDGVPVFTGTRVSVPHPACVIQKGEN